MTKDLKIGLIQLSKTADVARNRERLAEEIRKAASAGARLIVNQELHDSLYFCQTESVDLCDLAVEIPSESTDFYAALARELQVVIVTSMFERRAPGLYHNTAVVFEADGSIAGVYRKMHIPDDPAYYEKFYFTPGDLGFHPIDTSVGRIGVLVCWDQWYPEAARLMALQGAVLLVYPTAIGWESTDTDEEKDRQRNAWMIVQRAHAVANGIPVVTVNRVGHEPDPSGATNGIT
ncbi:MAG: carbon-nitrogen hydrolase, partial [Paramuribaculum sp.]|nr:carbon-nitrogen hydrolase [Paramuribaculum sp.]